MLPQAFVARMRALLGPTEAGALCTALTKEEIPVSIRYNPAKIQPESLIFPDIPSLSATDCIPWCKWGHYLPRRPAFALDPCWHAGAYYVQESSSMFIAAAYRTLAAIAPPKCMLDLCAAPGGKSTLWRTLLPDDALLVANEPVRQRANILAENLTKWGHPGTIVTQAYPATFSSLEGIFDLIAADVPCSGEGMFRKDQQARDEWSPEAVKRCAARQREILREVWPALREGGFLVYSTCTFNREENEDIVSFIINELGASPLSIETDSQWNIAGDTTKRHLPVYHFFPHRTTGEGLFLALLRKKSSDDNAASPSPTSCHHHLREKKQRKQESTHTPRELSDWLCHPETFALRSLPDGRWTAILQAHVSTVERLAAKMRVLISGTTLAESKGKKLIPHTALALSTACNPSAFPHVELSLTDALSFLRREALTLPPATDRGYVIPTYQGHPLGFLNNLGARANNLYPTEWKLRITGISKP